MRAARDDLGGSSSAWSPVLFSGLRLLRELKDTPGNVSGLARAANRNPCARCAVREILGFQLTRVCRLVCVNRTGEHGRGGFGVRDQLLFRGVPSVGSSLRCVCGLRSGRSNIDGGVTEGILLGRSQSPRKHRHRHTPVGLQDVQQVSLARPTRFHKIRFTRIWRLDHLLRQLDLAIVAGLRSRRGSCDLRGLRHVFADLVAVLVNLRPVHSLVRKLMCQLHTWLIRALAERDVAKKR